VRIGQKATGLLQIIFLGKMAVVANFAKLLVRAGQKAMGLL